MILAILQARMSSNRLPGKVMMPILGRPMLEHHIRRLNRLRWIDKLIIATSIETDDTPIADLCRRVGVGCFRGSLSDVLDRYYRAAEPYHPRVIVRLTGDCPLADPEVIDDCIVTFLRHKFDYVSNSIERTYPIGLDTEVFRYDCLRTAWEEASLPPEREHVTPFIYNHPERFSIGQKKHDTDISHHRWTVDEPQDFEFVKRVYEKLFPDNPDFGMRDILNLLARYPDLMNINYHIKHGQKYETSLREDVTYIKAAHRD